MFMQKEGEIEGAVPTFFGQPRFCLSRKPKVDGEELIITL
jgi:hypothetical protein